MSGVCLGTMLTSCIVFMAMVAPLLAISADDIFLPPSVTMNEPSSLIRSPLQKIILKCSATGAPKPTTTWYRNDVEVESGMGMSTIDKDGTLTLVMMELHKGKYQCKAKNIFGISQSNLTDVDMAFLNDFENAPAVVSPKTVQEGEPLKLDCAYSDPFSNPTPRWSWVMQDTLTGKNPAQESVSLNGRLSVDEKGNLYIQHVLNTDNNNDWYYLCEAWNPVMNIKKIGSPARLNVVARSPIPKSPPQLVHQNGMGGKKGFIEVIEGEVVSMYCIFKGYPKVDIIWRKTSGGPNPRFDYYNGNTMVMLEDVKNNDMYEGTYECQGQQAGTTDAPVVATFTVSVLQKPTFIQGPENINVTDGGSVTFTCKTQAEPAAQIEWLVNGKAHRDLPYDARRKVQGNRYSINKLRRGTAPADSDLQVVTCLAKNYREDGTEIGRSYKDGYINVIMNMAFITPPENHTISDSTVNVILDCEIKSDPSKTPMVSWHRDDRPITMKKDLFELAPNNSLIIVTKNFDNLDEVKGEYLCVGITRAPSEHLEAKAWVDIKEGVVPVAPIASASIGLWWIGLILVLLIILLIIILLCCLIRRNRGESYPVDEVERKMGNDPEKDLKDQGFHDYQRKEKDPIGGSRASLDSSIKPLDSDDDSMLEYGDIDTGKFNEDGSFIGIYGTGPRHADSQV